MNAFVTLYRRAMYFHGNLSEFEDIIKKAKEECPQEVIDTLTLEIDSEDDYGAHAPTIEISRRLTEVEMAAAREKREAAEAARKAKQDAHDMETYLKLKSRFEGLASQDLPK